MSRPVNSMRFPVRVRRIRDRRLLATISWRSKNAAPLPAAMLAPASTTTDIPCNRAAYAARGRYERRCSLVLRDHILCTRIANNENPSRDARLLADVERPDVLFF